MYTPTVTPYTPGNIDQTTRMLIDLKKKGQLQQYVQQHSQDPNLVALALYVNNLDNAARGAQAVQAEQQPQPTVLEEKMAQMAPQQLPEEVGIGALPVQGMDSFADGGIVAFGDGGEVPRYQYGGVLGDIPGMTQSNLYAQAKAKAEAGQPLSATEKALLFASAPLAAAADVAASPINFLRRNLRNPLDTSPLPSYTPASDARAQALGLGQLPAAQDTSMDNVIPAGTRLGASPSNAEIEQSLGLGALGADKGGAKQKKSGADGAAAAPAAAPASGVATLGADPILSQVKGLRKELGAGEETFDRDAEMARRKEYLGEHPSKAQMERLAKLEDMANTEKSTAANMALLRAGLGMLASKSQYAGVGIGEGALAGVESYTSALKDLKAAERDREKMRMDVESAAYAARAGDLKAVDDKYESFKNRNAQSFDRIASVYGTLKSAEMHGQSAEKAARIHAEAVNRTPAEIQLVERIAQERGIPFAQAYQEIAGMKREPVSMEKLRGDWLDMSKRMMIQQDYPNVKTFEDYVALMQPGAATGTGGGGGFRVVGVRPGP